jgi:BirA family biotin operon repressor/biotin-[acetyl-CoA-carboxylase] ligase
MQELKILKYKKLQSTNSEMQRLQSIEKLPEFSIVITKNQTNGKGLQGNVWESEEGKNLTFSMILYPDFIEIENQFTITCIITLALIDVLKNYLSDLKIKWTNDIYVNDKKLVGILIENSIKGDKINHSIIGIGLNVNQINFISGAPNPVSMKQITNIDYDTDLLLNEIINAIIKRYKTAKEQGIEKIRKEYHNYLYRNDGYYPYKDKNGTFLAKIERVEQTGHLVLNDLQGNKRRYAFKEVAYCLSQ